MNKYIFNSQMQKCDKCDSGSCYGSELWNSLFPRFWLAQKFEPALWKPYKNQKDFHKEIMGQELEGYIHGPESSSGLI